MPGSREVAEGIQNRPRAVGFNLVGFALGCRGQKRGKKGRDGHDGARQPLVPEGVDCIQVSWVRGQARVDCGIVYAAQGACIGGLRAHGTTAGRSASARAPPLGGCSGLGTANQRHWRGAWLHASWLGWGRSRRVRCDAAGGTNRAGQPSCWRRGHTTDTTRSATPTFLSPWTKRGSQRGLPCRPVAGRRLCRAQPGLARVWSPQTRVLRQVPLGFWTAPGLSVAARAKTAGTSTTCLPSLPPRLPSVVVPCMCPSQPGESSSCVASPSLRARLDFYRPACPSGPALNPHASPS